MFGPTSKALRQAVIANLHGPNRSRAKGPFARQTRKRIDRARADANGAFRGPSKYAARASMTTGATSYFDHVTLARELLGGSREITGGGAVIA